ncbi:EF-hand domain-containing protein [Streptomyces tsukubensis]|uniref:Calcium-binding protein n=1 Tax=Streptomyces tsukubensis TaxID=83656 RepID=A0A1V4A556_9ACTN|nr:EF-hand domain-containing protein [Streptomyces tsukubensis]OON75595.1 calcium-binding protein [Streptomyces tsukubensis]QFR94424.1 calcium-binding protein [Streptomyces tsukubensis]
MRAEAINRVRLVFTLFDANGNGYLDADDFELMADNVNEAARGSDAAAKDAMRTAFRGYWATLVAELDTDGDGKVSFDEFRGCVLSPERFDTALEGFAESLAALGAPEGDGLVTRPVFMALMRAIGFAPANIGALFDAFGPSEDDRIEAATWAEGIKEYYAPDKAGIPGDHLVEASAA